MVGDSIELFDTRPLVQAMTELDVEISTSGTHLTQDVALLEQGYYRDLFQVFTDHADVINSVTTWGI